MVKKSPREIEVTFRKDLGNVNPYINFIDVAVAEFCSKITQDEMPDYAKKHGHPRLHSHHLDLNKLHNFIHLSHLGFINSRVDSLSENILDYLSDYQDCKNQFQRKDTLRKIIAVIHASRLKYDCKTDSKKDFSKNFKEQIYIDYAGDLELKIVDYYRKIRNAEFHGGADTWNKSNDLSSQSRLDIQKIYKHNPNYFNELNTKDVILYSTVWQTIVRRLCSKLIDVEIDVLPNLCKKYKGKDALRREKGINNALAQQYLQSQDEIDRLRTLTNGWEA